MGLRLVAKTVNQDDPTVYHLFYASETGKPGSELTFFEYPGAAAGAGAGRPARRRRDLGAAGRAPRLHDLVRLLAARARDPERGDRPPRGLGHHGGGASRLAPPPPGGRRALDPDHRPLLLPLDLLP